MYHGELLKLIETHQKQLLLCGGAVGHLQHLSDNRELTFAEIKSVVKNAAEGKLEKVSEKLDGINLVFTYDAATGGLKVARSGGDIKSGGMDSAALAKKFFGRGNVELAFNSAFKILREALGSLPDKVKARVFGSNGNRWYSMEIIYAPDPNTISYDSNNIVFHGWPIFELNKLGQVEQSDDDTGIQLLTQHIDQMQKAISVKDWQVRGPSVLRLKKLTDGSIARATLSKIDAAMNAAGIKDKNTVNDYLRALMSEEVADLDLPSKAAKATVERAIGAAGAPTVIDIKRMLPKEQQAAAQDFVKASPELVKRFIAPIEAAIQAFAVEVLRGLQSTLIIKSDDEVKRLRGQLNKAIKAIETSGNQLAMDVLNKEMSRLGSVDNISAAMEGIVFIFKGNAYKFTGAFAPAHQILSLFKYGRKDIPKMDIGEMLLKHALARLLTEGGHAFEDVGPISLEDFKRVWPNIKKDLTELGLTNVVFVGSTGKKPVMGDIDLAAEFSGTRDELFATASEQFGHDNVTKVGANIVSVKYPITQQNDSFVQVDVMLGNTKYMSWSRHGTSTIPGHADFSPVKGVVRNVLLNVVNRFASMKLFPGKTTEFDRTRYSVDFDRGLFKVVQTKRNKTPGKPPLKDWRTVERGLVSDDPDQIVEAMFGKGYKANDIKSFENTVEAIRSSDKLSDVSHDILSTFVQELRNLVDKSPNILGDEPEKALKHIDQVVEKR